MHLLPSHLAVGGPALADTNLALAGRQTRQRRAVLRGARSGRELPAETSERLVASPAAAPQKPIVGGDDPPLRIEHDDPVVHAVDHGLEALALAAHLGDEAGHRSEE